MLLDLRPGGKYNFELVPIVQNQSSFNIQGIYQTVKNPEELAFTLNYVGLPGQIGESLVTIRLKPTDGGGTEMLFKQEFTLAPANMESRTQAWEMMFDRMSGVLEVGKEG